MLIDTHAHLYWDSFKEDFDHVIDRSIEAGITTIINVGVDVEKSEEALRLAKGSLSGYSSSTVEKLQLFSTIGIHPHEAIKYPDDESIHKDMDRLEQIYLSDTDKIVAVGECGLDYLFTNIDRHVALESPLDFLPPRDDVIASEAWQSQIKNLQRQLFQSQIDLAKKLNLPLIVHCRDDRSQNPDNSEAWDEVIDMTKNHFGIFHCYSGLEKTTQRVTKDSNFLVSFAATITYPKNEYLREAAKMLPLERIVLETDCPFLPPQSKRGQRNEPANIKEIAQLIAELKGISYEEVAQQTTKNVRTSLEILR